MFKEMRRRDRQLSLEKAENILETSEYGILSLNGDYPYGVPVSFIYRDKSVFIHCAAEGHKLDLIGEDGHACFTAVQNVRTRPEMFTADYESVLLFGKAVLLEGAEKKEALFAIASKYAPEHTEKAAGFIDRFIGKTAVIKITAEHITGKKSVHE